LIEGDDPEEAAQLLEKYGYTDENGEWIYSDD
jgi:ABC-type transport system substrate-binding protein